MLFSILVANYNNSRFLPAALSSVYAQTYTNWEVILVDDGSTDGFDQVITEYLEDPRIRVTRIGENRGCAYAKWVCAATGRGDIMAFLDPDDALVPNALELMIKAHQANPEMSLIYSTHYVCDAFLNVERISEKPKNLPKNTPYLFLSDGSIHHFAAFKRLAYEQSPGLVHERRYDKAVDQDLYYLLEEHGPVMFIDVPLYFYRIHSGSISNWGQEGEALKTNLVVVAEACDRRIKYYRSHPSAIHAVQWIKRYRTRYYKMKILSSARSRNWLALLGHLMIFPFVGGVENMVRYAMKLPRQGKSLIRKSFVESYRH